MRRNEAKNTQTILIKNYGKAYIWLLILCKTGRNFKKGIIWHGREGFVRLFTISINHSMERDVF